MRERAAQLLQLAEDRGQAAADRNLREPELVREATLAGSATPHSEHRNDIPGASCSAAADTPAQRQQQRTDRPADHHSTSAPSAAGLPLGSVVWAREKGWPHWPALLITKETSRGLCHLRKPLRCSDRHASWQQAVHHVNCHSPGKPLLQQKLRSCEGRLQCR